MGTPSGLGSEVAAEQSGAEAAAADEAPKAPPRRKSFLSTLTSRGSGAQSDALASTSGQSEGSAGSSHGLGPAADAASNAVAFEQFDRLFGERTLRVWPAHSSRVTALLVEGDLLYTASSNGGIKVWNMATSHSLEKTLQAHSCAILCLALDRVNEHILYSGAEDGSIKMWDLRSFRLFRTLTGHSGPVRALAPVKGLLYSASSDGSIKIWGPQPGTSLLLEEQGSVDDNGGGVLALAVRSENILYSAGEDCNIYVRQIGGANLATLRGHHARVCSLLLAGRTLYSGDRSGVVKAWYAGTAMVATKAEAELKPGPTAPVQEMAVLGDALVVAIADELHVYWRHEHKGHFWYDSSQGLFGEVTALAVTRMSLPWKAEEMRFYTGGSDGKVRIWKKESTSSGQGKEGPAPPVLKKKREASA